MSDSLTFDVESYVIHVIFAILGADETLVDPLVLWLHRADRQSPRPLVVMLLVVYRETRVRVELVQANSQDLGRVFTSPCHLERRKES